MKTREADGDRSKRAHVDLDDKIEWSPNRILDN